MKIISYLILVANPVKAKNILRDNRVRLCVNDQVPLYSFVTIDGIAEIISNKPIEIFKWAKIIAARYMGNDKAEEYGKRNSSEGELLDKNKTNQSYWSERSSRMVIQFIYHKQLLIHKKINKYLDKGSEGFEHNR